MSSPPEPLAQLIETWPETAREVLLACRSIFHEIARVRDLGALDENLKWGQPSWRPVKPRTGSTLRLDWSPDTPEHLAIFVDCKTDLAARMSTLYPDLPENDQRRRLAVSLSHPLPEQALAHLAEMTFTYHLAKRAQRPIG